MKFYDTDTHEIFEATRDEFNKYMELYHEDMQRDMLLTGGAPHIFVPRCPPLRGHIYFVYKFDEEYAMIKFEDKFVHFRWSDELTGKKVWAADTMNILQESFGREDRRCIVKREYMTAYPFQIESGGFYQFVYYDPNYDCKVAFNEGKQIQGRKLKTSPWMDVPAPAWEDDWEYRIKPEGLQWTDLHIGDVVR